MCGCTQGELSRAFTKSARALGLKPLDPVLYQARHSGASTDRASGVRTLAEIQKRGRWSSPASVVRYEKGGRLSEQLGRLPSELQGHLQVVHENLIPILRGEVAPPPPPAST